MYIQSLYIYIYICIYIYIYIYVYSNTNNQSRYMLHNGGIFTRCITITMLFLCV